MADVQPFRAVRYTGAAGALADLVAPPYDAVSDDERAAAVHTQPVQRRPRDAPRVRRRGGAHCTATGSRTGSSSRTTRSPSGWRSRSSSGRTASRASVTASSSRWRRRRTRREACCRTSARIRASVQRGSGCWTRPASSRSRSSCSRTSQLDLSVPGTPAEVEVDGTRLWRLPPRGAEGLGDAQLLIADGHHRYESAVELADELETDVRIMALVVPTEDAGLQLFPTHRVFSNRPDVASWRRRGAVCGSRRGARSPRE